ncbi:MAG: hypothetical protein V1708_05380, partial [Candidatus Micrarchaeota archaeon]
MLHDWALKNEEDGVTVWSLGPWVDLFLHETKDAVGQSLHCALEFSGRHMRWFPSESELDGIQTRLMAQLEADPNVSAKWRKDVVTASDALDEFSRSVPKDASVLKDREIFTLMEEHGRGLRRMVALGMTHTILDFADGKFTSFLEEMLARKIAEHGLSKSPAEFLAELTYVEEESAPQKELEALLQLAVEAEGVKARDLQEFKSKVSADAKISSMALAHAVKFASVYYGYAGPALSCEKVVGELWQLRGEKGPHEDLKRMRHARKDAVERRDAAARELHLSEKERLLLKAAQDAVFTKFYRRDAASHSFYCMEPLLREVSRRAGLDFALIECALPWELPQVLKSPASWKAELEARKAYCIYASDGVEPKMYSGKAAEAYRNANLKDEEVPQTDEVTGKCACPGKAIGRVKVIDTPAQMAKMEKGDILVSTATQPDIVPAMKK